MDGGAWKAAVHCVAKSRTRLSDFPFTFLFPALEKEMATHSNVLAWRIPGTGEPGGLLSVGSHRVGYDCSGLAAAVGRWRRVKIHLPLGHLLLSHCSVLARMPGVSTEDRGPDQASLFTQVITLPP